VATCPTQPSPGPGKRRASPRSSSDLLGPTASCLAAPVQQHFQHSRTRSPDRPPATFAVRTTKPLSKTAHNRLAPPYASPMVSSPLLCARASLESSPSRFDFALRLFANGANSVLGFGVDWFCLQNLGNRREMKLDEGAHRPQPPLSVVSVAAGDHRSTGWYPSIRSRAPRSNHRFPASISFCDCLRMVLIWCSVLVAGELAKSARDEARRDAAGGCDERRAPAERSPCPSSPTSAPTAPPSSSSLSRLQWSSGPGAQRFRAGAPGGGRCCRHGARRGEAA
jgi:hypothetical protein